MKAKHLSLVIAALLAAGTGLWLARSHWRADAFHKSSMDGGFKTARGQSLPRGGQPHADEAAARIVSQKQDGRRGNEGGRPKPPDPSRLFTDFTPEQRVQFARQGHGPGG